MDFHWSLSDNKFHQVSRTLRSILTDCNNALVWIVSTRHIISKSSSPYTNLFVTVPRAPIIISITVTFMFLSIFNSLVMSRYLSFFIYLFFFAFFKFYSVIIFLLIIRKSAYWLRDTIFIHTPRESYVLGGVDEAAGASALLFYSLRIFFTSASADGISLEFE